MAAPRGQGRGRGKGRGKKRSARKGSSKKRPARKAPAPPGAEREGPPVPAPQKKDLRQIGEALWELPASHCADMRVPVRIFADAGLVDGFDEEVLTQAANVATLPGVVEAVCCMPDAHWGYGFPIGCVAAMDAEAGGCFEAADPDCVSDHAVERGRVQLGTLGSGNHYLEVQVLREEGLFDAGLARAFGITGPGQVVVMFHCGSRGFGHQVASDYLELFLKLMPTKFDIPILDRELACAPILSEEGQRYYAAMCCAAKMSFANRQVIAHRIREVFSEVFERSDEALGISTVYDVSHNTGKFECHEVAGRNRRLLVHRKGATRAFPPGHPELPGEYGVTGQPVIIGGTMETGSYLLAGVESGAASFFSTAHGSGRVMSRRKARKLVRGRELQAAMEKKGILVRAASLRELAEEAGFAHKDVHAVTAAAERAGISRRVAHLAPVGNVKG